MKFKTTSAMLLAMGAFSVGAAQANEGSGNVTFNGSIISAPCSIAPDSTDIDVNMGAVAASAVNGGKTATPVPFVINLKDCTGQNSVVVKFGGTADQTNTNLLALQGGHATGAGIQLMTGNGDAINLGEDSPEFDLDAGDQTLRLQAALKGNSTTSVAVPGAFTSVANFTLAYN